MNDRAELPTLPFERDSLLGIAPQLRKLQQDGPLARVRTAVGGETWLITRYAETRQLLLDDRLSTGHPNPEQAARISNSPLVAPREYAGQDAQDAQDGQDGHRRMRALLTPAFSTRRMQALQERVSGLVDRLFDQMAAAGAPADLHESVSYPLPVLVICHLLGVPHEDQDRFRGWAEGMGEVVDADRANTAIEQMNGYMRELLAHKRRHPAEDVLTDLARATDEGRLTDEFGTQLAGGLLFAGHETTMARIDYGTLLLLANPEQRDALRADPSLAASAVEEILRCGDPRAGAGLPRYATVDFEIGGTTIRAGDTVLFFGGNFDERAFPDPDRFDIRRSPNHHLSFSHGAHFCIGANLARIELRVVFSKLFGRFPELRLAVPTEALRLRENSLAGGLVELPVAW